MGGSKWLAWVVILAMAMVPEVQAAYLNINASADMNDTSIVKWGAAETGNNWGASTWSSPYGLGSYPTDTGYFSNVLFLSNFTNYIAGTSTITSANISMFMDCGAITGARTIDLYMLNVGWLEGVGTGTTGNASWVGNATTRWISGSFSNMSYNNTILASGAKTCTPSTKERVTFEFNGNGINALNNMLSGIYKNYGFVMNISASLNGAGGITVVFKENATAFYTPRMELVYSVDGELPIVVTITSPANTSYTGVTTLPLVYYVTNYTSCTGSVYSLDGAANVTLDCLNGTISVSSGSHSIQVWVMNGSAAYTDTEHFTVNFAYYTINVTDEMTYTLYNGTNVTTIKLYVFCSDKTEITTLTSNPMNVSISCAFEEIKLEIVDKNNGTQWRTRYPTVYNGTIEFIMVNESKYDAIEQIWSIYDVTGDYSGGFLKVTKAILTYGIKTIEEKLIDASGNAVLYLIPSERYCFSVLNSAMTSERNQGCLYASSESSVRMEISRVPYAPDIDLTYKDILVYFTWDKDSQYIRGIYNDTLSLTSSVNFTVYNASAPTQVMFTSVSTFNYVVFTYNAVNTNGTNIAVITAINSKYGTLVEKRTIGFYATGQEKPSLPSGYGWLLSAAGGLISIFMMLAFGRKNQNIGIGVSVLFMLLFMYWGWFDSTPMLGWGFLTLITFIAVIGFFIRRDNT
jgi:hypothetical protein